MSEPEKPLEDCTPEEIFAQLESQLQLTGGARKHVQSLEAEVSRLQKEHPGMTEMEAIEELCKEGDKNYLWRYFHRVVTNCVKETGSFGNYRSPITLDYVGHEGAEEPESD